MATRASTIKVADLAKAVEKAVSTNTGAKIPGGIIMGIIVKPPTKFDVNLAARSITKEVQKSVAGAKLTPKVIVDGGFTTMGFIFRPVEFEQ
ncbi:MAG: hypothetical protein DMF76_00865 [Acidobacteria bacterium]|nr:MAG: hypothetical protein DMF76_00865 [Acidobacteriota bacterium]